LEFRGWGLEQSYPHVTLLDGELDKRHKHFHTLNPFVPKP